MIQLHRNQSPVDLVTVDAELSRRGSLEGVGGTAYLIELSQYVPTTANVKAYIRIVLEKSTLRKLIRASNEISQECYSQQNPLQETLNHAEKSIFDIVMHRASGESLVHVKEVLYHTYANIEELSRLKGRVSGVPTGFTALDNLLTGMHGGELILVGARPSMGKTSLGAEHCRICGTVCGEKRGCVQPGNAPGADCHAFALLRCPGGYAARAFRHHEWG